MSVRKAADIVRMEEGRALVDRLAASELFRKSPKLRDFLLYAADCTLSERFEDVREQVIAQKVFGRRADFQGSDDSIVRAEARNLRKRLEMYFTSEGAREPVVVTMPKGGYALVFEPRLEPVAGPPALPSLPMELVGIAPASPASGLKENLPAFAHQAHHRGGLWLAALSGLVALASLLLWARSANELKDLRERMRIGPVMLPFSALFKADREAYIVSSDTGFLQIGMLANRALSLDDYIARSYPALPNLRPPGQVERLNIYEFTDGREVSVAGMIMRNNAQFAGQISLRSGHQVRLQDFKDHNSILIGSPVSNPWAQLYEESLNFHCELSSEGRILFRERYANSGSHSVYPDADDVRHGKTYARIAFLPKTGDSAATLLVAGTTAQSTQAAGQFINDGPSFNRTLQAMGIDPAGAPRYFELLIRSNNFVEGAILSEVVTWRLKPASER